jgi:hypothetical protein
MLCYPCARKVLSFANPSYYEGSACENAALRNRIVLTGVTGRMIAFPVSVDQEKTVDSNADIETDTAARSRKGSISS